MPGPYELYLIRHGSRGRTGRRVARRRQAAADRRRHEPPAEGARGLAALGVSFDVVLTSPLVRTQQTADIVAGAFDPRPPIVTVDVARAGRQRAAVLADLEKQSRRTRIALVGHEPGIGELAAQAGRLASPVRVQERRRLPHRRRDAATDRSRHPALVPDAEDSQDDQEVAFSRQLSLRSAPERFLKADSRRTAYARR